MRLDAFVQVVGSAVWAVGADTLVRVDQLRDLASPLQYLNAATVTGQLSDSSGADVGGSISFGYVSGSDGRYDGTLPNTLVLTDGDQYTLTITASNAGLTGIWKITRTAKYDRRAY